VDDRLCEGFGTPATPRFSTYAAGRRPKSAKARSRGTVGGRLVWVKLSFGEHRVTGRTPFETLGAGTVTRTSG
jgi:hypothetical protein